MNHNQAPMNQITAHHLQHNYNKNQRGTSFFAMTDNSTTGRQREQDGRALLGIEKANIQPFAQLGVAYGNG